MARFQFASAFGVESGGAACLALRPPVNPSSWLASRLGFRAKQCDACGIQSATIDFLSRRSRRLAEFESALLETSGGNAFIVTAGDFLSTRKLRFGRIGPVGQLDALGQHRPAPHG